MKKKILFLHPHFRFLMGGTRFLFEVAQEVKLNKKFKNLEIIITVNQGNKNFIEKIKKEKIKIYQINKLACTNDIIYWLFFPIFLIYEIFFVFRIVKIEKIDSILAFLFPSNFIALVVSKLFKIKYYFYCYEPFPFFHNKDYINQQLFLNKIIYKTLAFLYGWLDILAVKKAKKIFTLNKITANQIKKIYRKNSIITWMGVNFNFFKPVNKNKNYFIRKYHNRIIVAHSTDYTEAKKTDLAIKTISYLTKKYKNILLLITSTQPKNPNKKKYLSLVKELHLERSVIFLDLIDLKILPHFYSSSVCYLSTSYDKMMGTTSSNLPVKEAMSCGVPCLRSNITDEDVQDGETGFLINPFNFEENAKKIEFLIKNKKIRNQMGKKAREFIIKNYIWQKVASSLIDNIYDKTN